MQEVERIDDLTTVYTMRRGNEIVVTRIVPHQFDPETGICKKCFKSRRAEAHCDG